jgi:alpha-tubulin suppressor-like RCC1 family protein
VHAPVPVQVTGLDGLTVTAIAAGGLHSLALLDDGTVLAWGRNQNGQLGDFTDIDRPAPVPVAALSDVVAIAAGAQGDHSVALLTDQSVRAWGAGADGQLGNGALADSPVPDVLQANEVLAIAAGAAHTLCVLVEGGVVACGLNTQGQLGDGTNTTQSSPVAVDGSGVAALAALGLIAAGDAHSLSQ